MKRLTVHSDGKISAVCDIEGGESLSCNVNYDNLLIPEDIQEKFIQMIDRMSQDGLHQVHLEQNGYRAFCHMVSSNGSVSEGDHTSYYLFNELASWITAFRPAILPQNSVEENANVPV